MKNTFIWLLIIIPQVIVAAAEKNEAGIVDGSPNVQGEIYINNGVEWYVPITNNSPQINATTDNGKNSEKDASMQEKPHIK